MLHLGMKARLLEILAPWQPLIFVSLLIAGGYYLFGHSTKAEPPANAGPTTALPDVSAKKDVK